MDSSGKTCEEDVALQRIEHTQYQCHYAHCSFKLLMMSLVDFNHISVNLKKTLANVATVCFSQQIDIRVGKDIKIVKSIIRIASVKCCINII